MNIIYGYNYRILNDIKLCCEWGFINVKLC